MKVLLVDDHPLFRDALAHVVRQLDPAVITLQASSAEEALDKVNMHTDLALVLIDLHLPGEDGIAALVRCRVLRPALPVVMVSSSDAALDQRRAFDAGARGYLVKTTPGEAIVTALRQVLAGEPFFPAAPVTRAGTNPGSGLTLRQLEVLLLICEGHSNKEVARQLDIAEHTVKVHVSAIFKALNVVSRTQAVLVARQSGLGAKAAISPAPRTPQTPPAPHAAGAASSE